MAHGFLQPPVSIAMLACAGAARPRLACAQQKARRGIPPGRLA
jgi:hypothetical protein